MKKISLFLMMVMILASCVKKQSPPTHENVEETVIALESDALDQYAQGDPTGFSKHIADDITYVDDNGAYTRIEGKEAFNNYLNSLVGQIPPHQYKIFDPLVQVYGDVAILTYQWHSKIDTLSGPPWKASSIYHFNDSIWQMVHAHWSPVNTE
jgi:ketosteroid isomerase-like protein